MATVERLRTFWGERQIDRERLAGLATAYWEVGLYGALLAFALGLRLWHLDSRAIHHDESLHMYYAWKIFAAKLDESGNLYTHVPFMHGPFKFFATALAFRLWPFGFDTNFSARLVPALFGTALVGLPFFLRPYLGRLGAFIAAVLLAASPVVLYVSRFNRDDILIVTYTLAMAIVIWRYLQERREQYLYFVPLLLMLGFVTMEMTFITTAIFLIYLEVQLASDFVDQLRASRKMEPVEIVVAYALLLPTAWLLAALWPLLEGVRRRWQFQELPAAGHLVIIIATFALPQFAAAVQKIPEYVGKVPGIGDNFVSALHLSALADQGFDTAAEHNLMRVTVLVLLGVSAYIGLLWNWRVWAAGAVVFYVPFVLLYTTGFQNPGGFWTGIWGSLDYWLQQQFERRGDQPDYYYFIQLPVYEFLPLIFATGGALYYAFRGKLEQQLLAFGALMLILLFSLAADNLPLIGGAHDQLSFLTAIGAVLLLSMDRFTKFLLFWTLSILFAVTVAGEKMPWLTVHVAVPLSLLGARVLADIFSHVGEAKPAPQEPAPRRGARRRQPVEAPAGFSLDRIAPLVYVGVLALLAAVVFMTAGPASAPSVLAWLFAAGAAGVVVWSVRAYSWRMAGQVAAAGLVAALFAFTVRASGMAAYDEGDAGGTPPELLIYAQGAPDLDQINAEIDRLARLSGRGRDLKIWLDNSEGVNIWPWPWYLREYEGRGLSYTQVGDDFAPERGSVVLLGSSNQSKLDEFADQYQPPIPYTHMWWFPEAYRGLTVEDFLGKVFTGDYLGTWRGYFIGRALPGQQSTPDRLAYFPIDFEAQPDVPVNIVPPAAQALDVTNQRIIGAPGSEAGQLSQPADLAIDDQGNVYVVDTLNQRIERFAPDGASTAIGEPGSEQGQFFDPFEPDKFAHDGPWGLAVDQSGSVYVADTWNHRIQKFDSSGNFVAEWSGATSEYSFFGPRDIDVDLDGNLLIVDTGNKQIVKFSPDGRLIQAFGKAGTRAGEFDEPTSLSIAANGDIYVADLWNQRIQHFDRDFQYIEEFKVAGWGSHGITDKAYILALPDGHVLATDPANRHILLFRSGEEQPRAWRLPETEGDNRPVGLAIDRQGQVYISDGVASVVRVLPLTALVPATP